MQVDALGRAAARIAASPGLDHALASAGVRRARAHFRIDRMIEEITAVYGEAFCRRPG